MDGEDLQGEREDHGAPIDRPLGWEEEGPILDRRKDGVTRATGCCDRIEGLRTGSHK